MGDDIENIKKTPISVDLGVKASLEVKAEIPPETIGRLVDALTDIIRPFTERQGLKADQIRLQREDIALKIAKKARDRAEIEQIQLHPVPIKLLVPFFEKASLEDTDNEMQDRWAALLLSASKEYQATHLTFIDILSRMSSRELKFLEEVCFSYKSFPETSYPGGHFESNRVKLEHNILLLALNLNNQEQMSQRLQQQAKQCYYDVVKAYPLVYGGIMYAGVSLFSGENYKHLGTYNFYSEFGSPGSSGFRSLEILERERLVNIQRIKGPRQGVEIGYFDITYLGVRFVQDCSPQAPEMTARRLNQF
ncbi:MAG: Abi-alpha family protein [Syntrophobacteraceae bacterium]